MRWLLAFIITTVVYILLVWLYIIGFSDMKLIEKSLPKDNRIKISIKEYIPPKLNISQKVESKIKKKKLTSKKKNSSKKRVKRDKKSIKKSKNIVSKKLNRKKVDMVYISTPLFSKKIGKRDFTKKDRVGYPNRKIKKLYGKEFLSYSTKQRKFIEKNLDEIHRITQNVLWQRGYPGGAISARTNQQGINIVSFYLHPNGDISDLKLRKKIGYRLLDENTIETIKTAYKDYPYPSETTKIVFYVEYSIFGY